MIPKRVFFTKGVGRHKDKLQSFELALRNAGIAHLNLVNVSSIFPPGCRIISKEKGVQQLKPGQITFVVMARNETDEPNRLIATSIGLAIPAEGVNYGYLSEHHCFGMTEKKAGDYAEDLAASMLASTSGIEFDPDTAYDERKEIYKMSGKIVRTSSISQSALGDKRGLWTTVIAAAVFIPSAKGEEEKPEEIKPQEVKEIPTEQQTITEHASQTQPNNSNNNSKQSL